MLIQFNFILKDSHPNTATEQVVGDSLILMAKEIIISPIVKTKESK
jgi:hypothetical protein